jgi:undecaprenyl-diphosphatase
MPWPKRRLARGIIALWQRMTLGALLALGLIAAAGVMFVELLDRVVEGDDAFDQRVYGFVLDHRSPPLTSFFRLTTHLADTQIVIVVVAAMSILAMRWRRRPSLAGFMVLVAVGASALSVSMKLLVGRARPDPVTMLATASGHAFPSGHAMQSVACYGALAICLSSLWPRRSVAIISWIGAAAVAVTVGLSRVYLGVHWATDVLSGWLLAGAWLAAAWQATLRVTSRPTRSPSRPGGR